MYVKLLIDVVRRAGKTIAIFLVFH